MTRVKLISYAIVVRVAVTACVFCIALVMALSLARSATADTMRYEAAKCRSDAAGKVFLQLGDEQFALPENSLAVISKPTTQTLAAGNNSEQEGCPDNPIIADGFDMVVRIDAKTFPNLFNPADPPANIRVVVFKFEQDNYLLENGNAKLFENHCKKYELKSQPTPSITECDVPPQNAVPQAERAAVYQVDQAIYATPVGRPVTIYCAPALSHVIGSECDIAYKFFPTINIYYGFFKEKFPASRWIDLDRSIRKSIELAHTTPGRTSN